MSQALSTIASLISSSITRTSYKPNKTPTPCLDVGMMPPQNQNAGSVDAPSTLTSIPRRNVIGLGIAGAICGLNNGENKALAAARRAPAPPTEQEKKDPNVSGVLAKVLASKKRKEAMKQAMAKERERGNKIEESSSSSSSPTSQQSSPTSQESQP